MKKDMMGILACPVCKSPLELRVVEEEEGEEVLKGSLICGSCDETYPIKDSIPHLLPPQLFS